MSDDPAPAQRLTAQEIAVLALMSQGMKYRRAAHELGTTEKAASEAGHRAIRKLGAASITQAVHIAGHLGLIGWYDDCGSRNAFLKHLRNGEPPCIPCRRANAAVAAGQRRRENYEIRKEKASAGRHVRTSATRRGSEQHQ